MENDVNIELKELAILTTHASEPEILKKATEIKTHLYEIWQRLGISINLVDSLVAAFAPNAEWQKGLPITTPSTAPKVTSPTLLRTTSSAVFRIAEEFASKGGVVTSKQIMRKLRAEGDQRPESHILTSIGNLLSKSGAWRKVRGGEYILIGKEEAKDTQRLIS
jgi:hypothetical protein